MRVVKNGAQRVSTDRRFTSFVARLALAATVLLGSGVATVTTSTHDPSASDPSAGLWDGTAASPNPNEISLAAAHHPTIDAMVAQHGQPGVTTYQETSASIAYRGSWSRVVHPGYLGRQALSSKRSGALATVRFTGIGISWIGPTGPTRGKAKIYIDGRYVKTVDTYAPRFAPSRVLFSATYATERQRTFTIVVLGTKGHPTVAIDALVVRTGGSPVAALPASARSEPTPTPTPAPIPTPALGVTLAPTATASPTPTPTATPAPGSSVRVTSIPALLTALANDAVTEIVVANGTYQVSGAASKATNSLWIGARFAARTRPILVRAETTGGVTFTSDGSYFGAISFQEGAHHQTWQGFRLAYGAPMESGVIMFGGYADKAGAHHITLRNITVDHIGNAADPHGHVVYFSHSIGGSHDILIDGFTVDNSLNGVKSALHFYHSESGAVNAWNVTVRNMHVTGSSLSAIFLWDATLHDILIEDSTITGAGDFAVRYEDPGTRIVLRRITSTASGQMGFYSSLGANPPGVTFDNVSLR